MIKLLFLSIFKISHIYNMSKLHIKSIFYHSSPKFVAQRVEGCCMGSKSLILFYIPSCDSPLFSSSQNVLDEYKCKGMYHKIHRKMFQSHVKLGLKAEYIGKFFFRDIKDVLLSVVEDLEMCMEEFVLCTKFPF